VAMGVIIRAGKKKHMHIKRDVPGWGSFRKSAGTTNHGTAVEYDVMVKQLGSHGAHDVLDALKDGRISLARCLLLWGGGKGLPAVRNELVQRSTTPLNDRLIAPRIEPFLEKGSSR